MGICASCLGLNRHPSQDPDESASLLEDDQPQYGGLETSGHLDEEELRRDREIMEQITAEAADNMIDVQNPNSFEFGNRFEPSNDDAQANNANPTVQEQAEEDADEAAWLESLRAEGIDATEAVKGLDTPLVMDTTELRTPAESNIPYKKTLRSTAS